MSTDAPSKARYCAKACVDTRALSIVIPDEYLKRIVSRSIFLHIVEFVSYAREARNDAARTARGGAAATLAGIRRRLNQLADRDWAPYAPLRDRLAAHRQPLADDDPTSWGAAALLWSEIDSALLGVLVDDVLAIWNDLAPLIGESPVLTPAIDATLASAVIAATTPTAPGVGIASGGLDVTRRDMLGVTRAGASVSVSARSTKPWTTLISSHDSFRSSRAMRRCAGSSSADSWLKRAACSSSCTRYRPVAHRRTTTYPCSISWMRQAPLGPD